MLIDFSTISILLFFIFVLIWLYSIRKVLIYHYESFNIKDIFFTFYGYVWLGFFTDVILRFVLLNAAPETYRATAFPLWSIPDDVFLFSFIMILLFWSIFTLFYFVVVKYKFTFFPNILGKLELEPSKKIFMLFDFISFLSLVAVILVSGILPLKLPRSLFTPIGYITSLYLIASFYLWYWFLSGKYRDSRRYLYLIPGIVYYLFNPYRENLLLVFIPILINYLYLKKDLKIRRYAFGFIIIFLFVTILNYGYRNIIWEGEKSFQQSELLNYDKWESQPTLTPWAMALNRFHALDSFLLTVYLVPNIYPYTNRIIVNDLIVQSLIPTALSGGFKSDVGSKRGSEFAESIWSYTGETRISARIAPSMFGDLYRSNGIWMVLFGAMLWGIIVGLFENYRYYLKENAFLILISLFGLRFFGAIERDFVFAAANIIQFFILIIIVLFFFPKK